MTRTSIGSLAGRSFKPSVFFIATVSEGASGVLWAAASPRGAQVRPEMSKLPVKPVWLRMGRSNYE
jgi:hypothetical protein